MFKLLFIVLVLGVAVHASDVTVLTPENFDQVTASGDWLLEFYAPWCGHCKKLAPIYEELATKVKGEYGIAKIDCDAHKEIGERFGIRGFPTIKYLKNGNLYEYRGERTVDGFVAFLSGGYSEASSSPFPKAKPAEKKEEASSTSDVVVLTDSTFDDLTSKGVWFLEFYAPWCGHCKRLAPIYENVAKELKGTVHVGKVDCTTEKAVCSQYGIQGYPTVYLKRDNTLRSYSGQRSQADMVEFAQTGWSTVDPEPVPEAVSGWKSQMFATLGHLEDALQGNIFIILAVCIVVGVSLGVCVVAMSPAPTPNKTIHYTPTTSSSSTSATTNNEITQEDVSKDD